MSEPPEPEPALPDAPDAELNARVRRVLREARTEAVVVLAVDVALLGGLAAIDKAKGWDIIDLPWWTWLLFAAPALLLIVLLLAVPLAELSPGPVRNAGVALLGLLIASDAVAVAVLLAALAGSSSTTLSAGELLAHGAVVWLTNIITFGLLFWELDEGGPRLRAERGRPDPDFQFPQDTHGRAGWSPRLSDYLYVSLTNAIAVSPTDTMPLTRRAKGLMAVESLISYAVVILVVARAVNVLARAPEPRPSRSGPSRIVGNEPSHAGRYTHVGQRALRACPSAPTSEPGTIAIGTSGCSFAAPSERVHGAVEGDRCGRPAVVTDDGVGGVSLLL